MATESFYFIWMVLHEVFRLTTHWTLQLYHIESCFRRDFPWQLRHTGQWPKKHTLLENHPPSLTLMVWYLSQVRLVVNDSCSAPRAFLFRSKICVISKFKLWSALYVQVLELNRGLWGEMWDCHCDLLLECYNLFFLQPPAFRRNFLPSFSGYEITLKSWRWKRKSSHKRWNLICQTTGILSWKGITHSYVCVTRT